MKRLNQISFYVIAVIALLTFGLSNCKKEPKDILVKSITLDQDTVRLTVGGNKTLTANVTPSNATNGSVTWSSANGKIAEVTSGYVVGISEGTTKIFAKAGNEEASCVVIVSNPEVPELVVDFNIIYLTATETVTPPPCEVRLESTGSNESTNSYSWKINGDEISKKSFATYTFNASGKYIVRLTVSNADDSDFLEKTVTIPNPAVLPEPDFTITYPNGQTPPPCDVTLTNTTNTHGLSTTYVWTVNGTQIATTENTPYTFTSSGTFTVRLTATNNDGSDFIEKTVTIPESTPLSAWSAEITLGLNTQSSWCSYPTNSGQLFGFNYSAIIDFCMILNAYNNAEFVIVPNDNFTTSADLKAAYQSGTKITKIDFPFDFQSKSFSSVIFISFVDGNYYLIKTIAAVHQSNGGFPCSYVKFQEKH